MKRRAMPIRTKMWRAKGYAGIDAGVRFAVKVLHAQGIDTCQSCQGGKGHAYPEPSIEMVCGSDDARGFAALSALNAYGLPVQDIAIIWKIHNGMPYEKLWRITFFRTMEDRANDWPVFEYAYRSYSTADDTLERDSDVVARPQ